MGRIWGENCEFFGFWVLSGFFLGKKGTLDDKKKEKLRDFALIYGRFECHDKNIG
jgi:hypothetical protein